MLDLCSDDASRKSTSAQVDLNQQGFIPIGGIEQWIAIQGTDAKSPAILFLHGGPGEAQSPFLSEFVPWEQAFTVIDWDQRGSGKTYGRNGPSTPGMAVERLAHDAIEVAEYACERLNKSRLILVGHSWGAMLGLYVIKREPKLFHAFVGVGPTVSWTLSLLDRERWTRQKATAERDEQTLKLLEETANLPVDDMKRIMASSKWRMSPSDNEYLKVFSSFVGQPPFPTEGEVADWLAGYSFSMSKLNPALYSFDARNLGLDMPVPFFIISGRDDHITSFHVARTYFQEVRSPEKALVQMDGGHFACFTNPQEFVAALVKHVTPLVGPK